MYGISITGTLVCVLAATLPAFAGSLPDGAYRCQMYSGSMIMHLGDIAIRGNTYQGPAYDGKFAGTYAYRLNDSGTIDWGGPMGGFDSGGNRVVSTVFKRNGAEPAFDVTIQLKSGNFSTVSCSLE
jgi:hypothetical protein